jgi:hypothetical protein
MNIASNPAICAGALALAAICAPYAAQADDIATPCSNLSSRADGTAAVTAACTPDKGRALLELGYVNRSLSNAAGTGAIAYPSAALRYGASHALEVDVDAGSYVRLRSAGASAHGYSDSRLGLRYRVFETERTVVSAVAEATLPTGSASYSAGKPQYSLGFASRSAIGSALNVETSLTYDSRYQNTFGLGPAWFARYAPALALVTSPSQRTSFYVEGSGATKIAAGLGPQYTLGAGVRHEITSRTMVDLGFKDGLTVVNGTRAHEIDIALTQMVR